jgi:hypothetical protein
MFVYYASDIAVPLNQLLKKSALFKKGPA